MTKCINFELSKKLNDLGLLDDIETEYCYYSTFDNKEYYQIWQNKYIEEYEYFYVDIYNVSEYKVYKKYKTLTLDEAIEFLPMRFKNDWFNISFALHKNGEEWIYSIVYSYNNKDGDEMGLYWWNANTPLGTIEKMLECLIDNNLLTKDNIWKH